MPYRVDLLIAPESAFDILAALGALDIEPSRGGLAALMPDAVTPEEIASALGVHTVEVSAATGRDDDSVWTLSPRRVHVRTMSIVPAGLTAPPGAIRLADGAAFGTGLHATTTLCLEALQDICDVALPARVLDVGTGSGILALAALQRGVPEAVGLDLDPDALRVAAENGRLNDVGSRLSLVCGGAEAVAGSWPLVLANIRAAELIETAPILVRRVARGGWLVLSGIPWSVGPDVERTYRRLGVRQEATARRDGWIALTFRPSW